MTRSYQHPYSRAEDNVGRLAGAGVTILAGTDAPNPGTVIATHRRRGLLRGIMHATFDEALTRHAEVHPALVMSLRRRPSG